MVGELISTSSPPSMRIAVRMGAEGGPGGGPPRLTKEIQAFATSDPGESARTMPCARLVLLTVAAMLGLLVVTRDPRARTPMRLSCDGRLARVRAQEAYKV